MSRLFAALLAILTAELFGIPAQAQLIESPITVGFWSFPTHKTKAAQDVAAVCRNHFEIRFADGHFLSLGMFRTNVNLVQREIESVGRCAFNREKQIDNCEMKFIHCDGSILAGTAENRYSFDAQKTLKMP